MRANKKHEVTYQSSLEAMATKSSSPESTTVSGLTFFLRGLCQATGQKLEGEKISSGEDAMKM